jgi:hypothetical protein
MAVTWALAVRMRHTKIASEKLLLTGEHSRRRVLCQARTHQHQHREWKVQVGAPRPARTVNVSRACASTTQRAINNLSQWRRPPVHAAARSDTQNLEVPLLLLACVSAGYY